ncbi:MAG TPA: MFS transporter, partial [Acidiphilium sp.]
MIGHSPAIPAPAEIAARPRALLLDRRFAALFWCQGFAAFNDNFLKTALTILILYRAHGSSSLIALAGAVFIFPYLVFSGQAGELADRADKAVVATRVKGVEIAAAGLAVLGFLTQSVPVLFAALACFGVLAALFGPVKYGLLPDLLATGRLPSANALVDFATFLAILLGTALGGALGARNPVLLAVIVMGFALAAFGMARLIPRPGPAKPNLALRANPVAASRDLIRTLRARPELWRAALVNTWFWTAGIVCLTLLPILTRDVFHRGPDAVTVGLTVFSLGIGAGSFLAARLMHGRISLAPARWGSVVLGIGALATAAIAALGHFPATLGVLFIVAASGGLIAVPSFAAVQAWAEPDARARSVAGTNILNAGAMVAVSLVLAVLLHAGIGARAIF